jgi:hypothetical protein
MAAAFISMWLWLKLQQILLIILLRTITVYINMRLLNVIESGLHSCIFVYAMV